MIRIALAAMAAAALLAPAAMAQTTTPAAPATEPAQPVAKKDQIVCRQVYRSGSRIPTEKKCMTRADWDKLKTGKEELDAAIRASLTRNPSGG